MQVSPALELQILHVGVEQTPVIIIDNFVDDINALRTVAQQQVFERDAYSFYPGIRSQLPKSYVVMVLNALYQKIYDIYQIPYHLKLKPQDIYFSLITLAPEHLSPMQRIPHFDTSRPYYFAVLHYINPEPHGGTQLFQHKSTQLTRISEQSVDAYLTALSNEFQQLGEPESQYCTSETALFKPYHHIEYKQNRLVIYPGNLLHSTDVKPTLDISSDIATGRLTANIFIEFKAE
jgi:hypothetical protein